MASRVAVKRLTAEYKDVVQNPTPYVIARPSEKDILVWYFLLTGPPDTPYENGQYLGQLRFPANYPFGPPNIRMFTPSGRFLPNTSLCLSMSDFHKETWNPAWNVSTILSGLLSFMTSEETSTGAMSSTPEVRRNLAQKSIKWNMANEIFRANFPDIMQVVVDKVQDPEQYSTILIRPPKGGETPTEMDFYGGQRVAPPAPKSSTEAASSSALPLLLLGGAVLAAAIIYYVATH